MILADTVAGQGRQLAAFLAIGAGLGLGLWLIYYIRFALRIGNVIGGAVQGLFSIGVFALSLYIEHAVFGGELAFFHAASLILSAAAFFALMFRLTKKSREKVRLKCDSIKSKLSKGKIGRFLLK